VKHVRVTLRAEAIVSAVTTVAHLVPEGYGTGIAFDAAGTLWISGNGASKHAFTGALDTMDTTTGAVTTVATLDSVDQRNGGDASIDAMAFANGTLYGVINTGMFSPGDGGALSRARSAELARAAIDLGHDLRARRRRPTHARRRWAA
jgi:hypothetical protein